MRDKESDMSANCIPNVSLYSIPALKAYLIRKAGQIIGATTQEPFRCLGA